jgi:hypothetical protein
MNAWSHLPNAAYIDRILASVKSQPELWNQAWVQVGVRARGRVWDQVRDQAWEQAWYQVRDQAWVQARDQARDQVWYLARDQAIRQVAGPLLALIAYDDSAKYLNLPIDQLEMLYHLTEHPACILLQPAVVAFAMEKERELAQG